MSSIAGRPRWSARAQSGGVLIELGLILPVLAIMAVGVVNIGMSLGEKQMLVEATRTAARRAGGEGLPDCEPGHLPNNNYEKPVGDGEGEGEGDESDENALIDCETILRNGVSSFTQTAKVLGDLYACQMVEQAGMAPASWVTATSLVSRPDMPTVVEVMLQPNERKRKNYFISTLMGRNFPSAKSRFFVRRVCGSNLVNVTDE